MKHLRLTAFRYAPAIGGAENYSRRLMREFGEHLDVDVIALLKSQRTDWLNALIDGERDESESYEVDGRTVTALGRWPREVRRKMRGLVPLYHMPNSFAPAAMGKLLAPHLAFAGRDMDVMHNVFMGREAFSLGMMLAAHAAGRPFVFTPLRHQRPLGWNSPAFRRLYRESEALIALTQGEADWLRGQGAPPGRIHVIGIGPQNDPAASTELATTLVPGAKKIVLFIGQLHAYKGVRALLAAAALMRSRSDVMFVFAGPDVRGTAREFERAGPNARWLGTVDNPTRDSLLNACAVLCVPSARESFGSVIIEAWASAKPVVGGPAAATKELIEDGVDGWTVPQEPQAIASRLTRLIDDPSLARQMGARGKEKVARRYSWDAIANAHLDVYRRVVEDRLLP